MRQNKYKDNILQYTCKHPTINFNVPPRKPTLHKNSAISVVDTYTRYIILPAYIHTMHNTRHSTKSRKILTRSPVSSVLWPTKHTPWVLPPEAEKYSTLIAHTCEEYNNTLLTLLFWDIHTCIVGTRYIYTIGHFFGGFHSQKKHQTQGHRLVLPYENNYIIAGWLSTIYNDGLVDEHEVELHKSGNLFR